MRLTQVFAATRQPALRVRDIVRPWLLRVVTGLLAGLVLVGCSTPDVPFVSKSADQLAVGAVNTLSQTPVLHIQGKLTGDKPYQVDVTGRAGGAAVGSGVYDGHTFSYRDIGGKQYLKGAQFWQTLYTDSAMRRQARGYQDNWVVASQSPVTTLLGLLVSPITIAPTLGSHAKQMSKGQEIDTPSGRAVALRDGGITYYVTTSSPTRLVRVQTDRGYREPSGLSDVQLDIGYPTTAPSVQAPSPNVDPTNPVTLPALYEATAVHDVQPCDQNACTFQITLVNKGGAPAGTTTVTMHMLTDTDRKEIANCAAPVPDAAHGQEVTTTCTISGPAWTSYLKSGSNVYYAEYSYENPPYDP